MYSVSKKKKTTNLWRRKYVRRGIFQNVEVRVKVDDYLTISSKKAIFLETMGKKFWADMTIF